MSLAILGNSSSKGAVLNTIRAQNSTINYYATGNPISSGSLVTTGITSGTFDLYRVVGRVNTGNTILYILHIKNLTMPNATTSGNINFGPRYVPLTGQGFVISTVNGFQGQGTTSVNLNVSANSSVFTISNSAAVTNASFCYIFGGVG